MSQQVTSGPAIGVSLRHLLPATLWLGLAFIRAAWYFRTRALRDLALPHPESLSSREKRRLKHYFYGTTYLSVVFCMIRRRIRSHREKHLFTNLAALTYFFDDLVDAFREQDDSGILWQNNPEQYGRTADPRGLALHFLHNIYGELPAQDLVEFKSLMHGVFNIETGGRQQGNKIADIQELEDITAKKGGYSVLLFRRVLANPLSETEYRALYHFGYLIQLCDDIFDIWFDRQAGIRTIPILLAEQGEIDKLTQHFENQVYKTKTSFQELRAQQTGIRTLYQIGGVKTSWAAIHFLLAITRVCLQHYQELQKKHGHLPLDDRAILVVDMERWRNRMRAAWQVFRS